MGVWYVYLHEWLIFRDQISRLLDNLLSNMEVIFGIHMNKAIPKALVVQVLNPRHKATWKTYTPQPPLRTGNSGILPVKGCWMLWVHETISIFINPKLRKGQKVKNPQISPKPPKPITKQPPKQNSNQPNFTSVLSQKSRSSQRKTNRLSVLGGSSQLVSG